VPTALLTWEAVRTAHAGATAVTIRVKGLIMNACKELFFFFFCCRAVAKTDVDRKAYVETNTDAARLLLIT
jgi:hypothetical protein